MNEIKVVVIGSMGVGKSSLTIRFAQDKFNDYMESTLGAAYFQKLYNYGVNKTIKFQFWDTAGQEKYKSIAKIYYKDCKMAIGVYDVTKKESFQALKIWIQELKASVPANVIIAIVGNKMDLISDKDQKSQHVSYQLAKQYAAQIGAIFKCTSVKENKGVIQLFESLAQRFQLNHDSEEQSKLKGSVIKNSKVKTKKKPCC